MKVRCFTESADWVVVVDGVIRARFSPLRYGRNAVFYAAREANKYRLA